jgi:glycosyltransferase involved in cell wall biosynthesis
MKIAFDYQIFGLQKFGGISRYYTKLAQGLISLNQEVMVLSPMHKNSYLEELPDANKFGRRFQEYPNKTDHFFSVYNYLFSKYYLQKWKPGIVHETYYSKMSVAPSSSRVVITVHDMIDEIFSRKSPSHYASINAKRLAIERAAHIICVSTNTKTDLMNIYNTPAKKISVIHHGVDKIDSSSMIQSCKPGFSEPFILYVGKRSGYKNFKGFISAIAKSKRLSRDFKVVAFGGGRLSSSELNMIKELGLSEEKIHQTDGDDQKLANLYKTASAFIYPSFYEGFGMPVLEAMEYGCPVISSIKSSLPEVVGDAGEYFDPADFECISQAIENVVYSTLRTSDLILRGNRRASLFSWDKTTKATLDVYMSL